MSAANQTAHIHASGCSVRASLFRLTMNENHGRCSRPNVKEESLQTNTNATWSSSSERCESVKWRINWAGWGGTLWPVAGIVVTVQLLKITGPDSFLLAAMETTFIWALSSGVFATMYQINSRTWYFTIFCWFYSFLGNFCGWSFEYFFNKFCISVPLNFYFVLYKVTGVVLNYFLTCFDFKLKAYFWLTFLLV